MRTSLLAPLAIAACLGLPAAGQAGAGADRRGPPAPFFMSPMGEPFRGSPRGMEPLQAWFSVADGDRDGGINLAEMQRDAIRFFESLDVDGDGEIEPDEVTRYENEVAPELLRRPAGRGGGFGGPGRTPPGGMRGPGPGGPPRGRPPGMGGPDGFPAAPGAPALLGLREPVASADENLNRGVTRAEFLKAAGQRLVLLDRNRDGRLQPEELAPLPPGRRVKG